MDCCRTAIVANFTLIQPLFYTHTPSPFSLLVQALHLVVIPMTTAFYNIFAMVGIFPELEQQVERFKIQHHLRYVTIPVMTSLPFSLIDHRSIVHFAPERFFFPVLSFISTVALI